MNTCDGGHDTNGEIRKLPIGGDANVLVCVTCFQVELRDRPRPGRKPKWGNLEIVAARAK